MNNKRIVLDLTTSVVNRGKDAFGILRVEHEITKALLASSFPIEFFAYSVASKSFYTLDRGTVTEIVGPNSHSLKSRPDSSLLGPSFKFDHNDTIIASGMLWTFNFLNEMRHLKSVFNLNFIAIVYDIIPILFPEFTSPGTKQIFERYIWQLSDIADILYSISDATTADLSDYLRAQNRRVPPIRRITLGADSVQRTDTYVSGLIQHLNPGSFVLCVCSIDPRKNHATLFNVWRAIYEKHPDKLVPLVIVGKLGVNMNDLINMIGLSDRLYPQYIKIWTDIPDRDLGWLYANCMFSVYPSYYEGWGLPIAESLSYGKLCIASDSSSMGEVAQGMAELINPLDQKRWIHIITQYLLNPEMLKEWEERIEKNYTPFTWNDCTNEFISSLENIHKL